MWDSWDHGSRLRSQVVPVRSPRAQSHPHVLPAMRFEHEDDSGPPSLPSQGLCPLGLVVGIVYMPVLGNAPPPSKGLGAEKVPRAWYL